MGKKHFGELDNPKAAFLKGAMKVHRSARNRLTFLMAGEPRFVEKMRRGRSLHMTKAFRKYLAEWEAKLAKIDPDFYHTPAMTGTGWRAARRASTRGAVHGNLPCIEM